MRGILRPRCTTVAPPRITPAHAGNTSLSGTVFPNLWDHPRACGEYSLGNAGKLFAFISPPRMRGIQDVVEGPVVRCGITPAHAGNTVSMARAAGADLGSPPRMRGIPDADVAASPALGITPAHAGNTSLVKLSSNRCRDHPRACGEYCCLWGIRPYRKGSPPRMRGIPLGGFGVTAQPRITPAHAGNTDSNFV